MSANDYARRRVLTALKLQAAVVLYAGVSMCSKWAAKLLKEDSGVWDRDGLACGGDHRGDVRVSSGVRFFWQKLIKGVPIGVAYANKSTNLLWAQLFAVTVFAEGVTGWNWAGMALVLCGVLLVNSGSVGGGRSSP